MASSHLSIEVEPLQHVSAGPDLFLQLADVRLQELGRTRLLTFLLALEVVACTDINQCAAQILSLNSNDCNYLTVSLTAAVVEGLTSLLKVVKIPLWNFVLTRARSPGQQTHRPGAPAVLAAVLALSLGDEAVHVA